LSGNRIAKDILFRTLSCSCRQGKYIQHITHPKITIVYIIQFH
jgi:hypothetical protein